MTKANQVKNTALYLIPVILGNALPILTLPIFTRILSVQEYGVYALAQVYGIFVNGISNFGLTVGYERNFFESDDKVKRAGLLYSTLSFVAFTYVFFGLVTYLFKGALSAWVIGDQKHQDILFWSYCAVGITGLKTYFLIYFKNIENAKANVWYTIDESLITVVLSCFMLIYLRTGIIGLVLGQLISSAIIVIALVFRFLRMLPLTFDWVALRSSLRLSFPLTPRIFLGVIGSQFDKYMIGLLSTIGGVGVYNIGQKFANITFTFTTAIQNVFGPQVYKRMFDLDEEEGGKSIGSYLTPFLYASITVGLLLGLFSEELIIILTPQSYHDSIDVVSIFSLLFGTYFFGKQPQLIYAKKTIITSVLTLVTILLNIGINIPFIAAYGVIGAAWGSLLAGVISGVISFYISQKYYKIFWESKKVGLIFFVFFASIVLCIVMRDYQINYGLRVFFKIACVVVYGYIGVKFKILSAENISMLKEMYKTSRAVSGKQQVTNKQ